MHSPPLGAPWTPHERSNTNGTSIFALVASLLGYVCFVGVGGVLGIVLGLIARNEISRSAGREKGRGLANAAIALGTVNLCLTVVGLAVGIAYLVKPKPASTAPPPATALGTIWAPPSPSSSSPHAPLRNAPVARASREAGSQVTTLGTITLADISNNLELELKKQRIAADAKRETLVLWLVVSGCRPCDGVAAALSSQISQKALAHVRLVRVDRDELQIDLEQLGIPTEKIPAFVLLDSHDRPRDFMHGGEWDADIPSNIAPILGKFAHGRYAVRRHPWHGPVREDETPL